MFVCSYTGRGAGVRKSLPARGHTADEAPASAPAVIPNQVKSYRYRY